MLVKYSVTELHLQPEILQCLRMCVFMWVNVWVLVGMHVVCVRVCGL